MTIISYKGNGDLANQVEKNGFFILRDFLSLDSVLQAKKELSVLLDRDLSERESVEKPPVTRSDNGFKTTNTQLMQTRLFPSWESRTFTEIIHAILTSPIISDFMHKVIGDFFRLRVDLIRRSSGANDFVDKFQLPHVWHRDTAGEFTFGIIFDDMDQRHSGGTCYIPGTHWDARDPRWDLMLSQDCYATRDLYLDRRMVKLPKNYYRFAKFNHLVRAIKKNSIVETRGRPGDIYFFFNDTWHGRSPNTSGNQHMVARFGGFPTEYPFKNDIPLPKSTTPSLLRNFYAADQPMNRDEGTLINRINRKRRIFPLSYIARMEKNLIIKHALSKN